MDQQVEHSGYMQQALELACQNLRRPFASVIVDTVQGEVVARGLNRSYRNPTAHSELVAIQDLCDRLHGDIAWGQYTLYTTAEPNPMNMAAILWAGIPRVVFGTCQTTLRALGYRQIDISAAEVVERSVNLTCELIGGVMEAECNELFKAAARFEKLNGK